MYLGVQTLISNLSLPTGLEDKELPTDTDSDFTSVVSSGVNGDDSTYLGSHKNSPAVHDTTLDLLTITEESGNIHEVFNEGITELNSPRTLLTAGHGIDPADIEGGYAIHTETPLDYGKMPPLLTQPPYKSPPLVDAPYNLE